MRLFSLISVALSASFATSSSSADPAVPTEPYIVVQKRQTTGSTVTVSDDIVTNGRVCVQTRCLTAADILYLLDLKAKLTVDAGTNSVKLATAGMTVGARNPLAEIDSLQGTVNSMAPLRAAVTANDQTVNINRNICVGGQCMGADDVASVVALKGKTAISVDALDIKGMLTVNGRRVTTQLQEGGAFGNYLTDWGILRNGGGSAWCLDTSRADDGGFVYLWPCHGMGIS